MATKRILLAVDRSPRADAVATIAAETARGARAMVCLLHVTPEPAEVRDPRGQVVVYADQETESLRSQGLDYLRGLEAHFAGLPVESVVRFGDPVAQILEEAEAFGADLIVVGTAGRSGIGRVLLGSVAERVFGKATVPVMLVRPTMTTTP
ncbi:MAG TPA: universal stress protein [Methylomirabilota bacterium]|nr:universal stress protein [Methylomirabilota bacterium]